jgi:hypothetical protein
MNQQILKGIYHLPLLLNHVKMKAFTSNEGSNPSFIFVLSEEIPFKIFE